MSGDLNGGAAAADSDGKLAGARVLSTRVELAVKAK